MQWMKYYATILHDHDDPSIYPLTYFTISTNIRPMCLIYRDRDAAIAGVYPEQELINRVINCEC